MSVFHFPSLHIEEGHSLLCFYGKHKVNENILQRYCSLSPSIIGMFLGL